MRVIAGSAKGRPLRAPAGDRTRPTSDFVREAIFNSLGAYTSFEGPVADLFAGSGALGIEALSRGAPHATFVESDRRALEAVRANLERTEMGARATVLAGDALKTDLPEVDVAFADPPYVFDGWPTLLARLTAQIVVLESDRAIDPGDAWRVLRVKKYGSTVVTLASPRSCS
jgi:16S rRNA (guanine966-N2)-methyltransferase